MRLEVSAKHTTCGKHARDAVSYLSMLLYCPLSIHERAKELCMEIGSLRARGYPNMDPEEEAPFHADLLDMVGEIDRELGLVQVF